MPADQIPVFREPVGKLRRRLEGDLDNIVAKALRKEAGEGHFGDVRLERRFKTLLAELSERMGSSIPFPVEEKESFRWLENLRQSSRWLAEPARCVHIGDRESDIFELFCAAQEEGSHFLVRTCVDRVAGGGQGTVAEAMKKPGQSHHACMCPAYLVMIWPVAKS